MAILFAAMLLARNKDPENEVALKPSAEAIPSHEIRRAPFNKHWFALSMTSASVLLAAFTVWDVLLPSVALRRANTLYDQGQPAGQAYKKAIGTGRYHPQAHANYANALLQQDELEEARRQLQQALKGQDTADLHLALGYIHLEQGNKTLAHKHLQAATHRWPKNQTAQQYLQQAQP